MEFPFYGIVPTLKQSSEPLYGLVNLTLLNSLSKSIQKLYIKKTNNAYAIKWQFSESSLRFFSSYRVKVAHSQNILLKSLIENKLW